MYGSAGYMANPPPCHDMTGPVMRSDRLSHEVRPVLLVNIEIDFDIFELLEIIYRFLWHI